MHLRFVLAVALLSGVAVAEPQERETLDEVIVTAQRRTENLQRVPIAVTALTQPELQREQITDLRQLQQVVPSLAISTVVANSMTATISLRGQFEPDFIPTNDPAVGTYLDGVYIARMTGANLELVDMQRAEVLRGPQGTLFGRNAIGGAINLVSNPPVQRFEGSLTAAAGNYSSADLTGVVNLPIAFGDGAVRIAAMHSEHRGYGRAVRLDGDLSDDDTSYLRAQWALKPADGWNLNLAADMTATHTRNQLITFLAAFDDTNRIPELSGNPTDTLASYSHAMDGNVQSNRNGGYDARVWGTAATLTRDFSRATLKSISAFRRLDLDIGNADLDGTPYDIAGVIERSQIERQMSQELQLHATSADGRQDWTAGLLYFSETARFKAHNINLVPLLDTQGLTRAVAKNDSVAAYVQLTQTIAPNLRLTGGLRYNVDWRQLISRNAFLESGAEFCRLDDSLLDTPEVCRATLPRRRFSYVPFTLGVDYRSPNSALFYAKVSRGHRAGGYNMRGGTPVGLLTFGPERVTSYEIGAKADLFDRRLRVDLALYRSSYDDIQLGEDVADPLQGITFIKQNGGRARIIGGELELAALLGPLRLNGSFGLSDGKYLQLAPAVDGISLSTALALPKTTYSIGADLPIRKRVGLFRIHVGYARHSDDADQTLDLRCLCQNAHGLLSATLMFAPAGKNFELGLWGHNLTATHYFAQIVDFDYFIDAVPGDPRTYGLTASYKFGVGASGE